MNDGIVERNRKVFVERSADYRMARRRYLESEQGEETGEHTVGETWCLGRRRFINTNVSRSNQEQTKDGANLQDTT